MKRFKKVCKIFLIASYILLILHLTAQIALVATGCSYPGSPDSFTNKSSGDFLTVADVNKMACAIEQAQIRINQFIIGKSGGQTIKGGTAASDGLFLQSTSGSGTTGDFVKIIGGNDGATTWATFNQGKLLMQDATPTGSAAGDIVLPVTKRLAFAYADTSSSANSGMFADGSNNLIIDRPSTSNVIWWRWAGTLVPLQFSIVSGGAQITFAAESIDPAPSANEAVLYTKDNGSGKTQMCAKFNSGASQCFATEP